MPYLFGHFLPLQWRVLNLPFPPQDASLGELYSFYSLVDKDGLTFHRGAFRVTGRGRSGEE
jgi:hypothetical protein